MSGAVFSGLDWTNIPLAKNPNGAPPDFDGGPSLRPVVLGVDITMILVSAMFVGIRTWVNCRQLSKIMPDDIFCIFGWILFFAYCIVCMTLTTTARHTWDVPLSAILCILYPLSTWSAKMAIFVLYLRLFGRAKWMKWSCWLGLVFSTILYWTAIVLLSVNNFPRRDEHWDLALGIKIQKAQNTFVVWLIMGSFNLFLDIFLLLLPIPIIMGLKMSLQKRIGLAGVFLIGVVGVAGGVLGVYYRVYTNTQKFSDPTWYAAVIYLVIAVEVFVTLIVSCFPACISFYKTAIRDSRLFQSVKSRIPISFSRSYGTAKATSRSSTISKWLSTPGSKAAKTEKDVSHNWHVESTSQRATHGSADSSVSDNSPLAAGGIVKRLDVSQTTS